MRSGQLAARAIVTAPASSQTAGYLYKRLLEPIRRDLRLGCLLARCFYGWPNWGYWALTSLPVKRALMKGFARGWTMDRIKQNFYKLPFLED